MEQKNEVFLKILNDFTKIKVVIIGDLMLDKYIYGNVSRISPEAPVPVIKFEKEYIELGGSGNVASNIVSLGGEAFLFSSIGNDPEGEKIKSLLKDRNIKFYLHENGKTTHKQRIIGKHQHILRIDYEETSEKIFNEDIKNILAKKLKEANVIIISDYAKGVITQDLMDFLEPYKHKIILDPKPANPSFKKNPLLYKGVLIITPNEKEAYELSGCSNTHEAAETLKNKFNSNVLVTLGERGLLIYSDKLSELPSYAREAQDLTGAGDSLIAALALATSCNASLPEAAILANHAAGIAVEKRGTYSVTLSELQKRIFSEQKKLTTLEELRLIIENEKRKGKKIVWTNGCFDIYSRGQKNLLEGASSLGHILVVGIDSDESIRALKGPGRPINSEAERAEILSSVEYVDYIVVFPANGAKECLKILNPDVYAKGGDYNLDTINQEERKIVEEYGGQIIFVGQDMKNHTTDIIKKIAGK